MAQPPITPRGTNINKIDRRPSRKDGHAILARCIPLTESGYMGRTSCEITQKLLLAAGPILCRLPGYRKDDRLWRHKKYVHTAWLGRSRRCSRRLRFYSQEYTHGPFKFARFLLSLDAAQLSHTHRDRRLSTRTVSSRCTFTPVHSLVWRPDQSHMRIYWLSASLNPTTRYIPLAYRTRAGESRAVREARSCSLSLPAEEETELTCNLYAGSGSAHL